MSNTTNTKTLLTLSLLASTISLGLAIYSTSNLVTLKNNNAELKSLINTQQDQISKIEIDNRTYLKTSDDALINQGPFKEFIMNNPDVIVKSLAKMRFEQEQASKKEASKKVGSLQAALYEDKSDPVMGNPNGTHVLVEFIDNNCIHCKHLAPTLEKFVLIDPQAKVIVKEFPIFQNTPSSHYAALIGTAIWMAQPEKYEPFHKIIINAPRIDNNFINATAEKLGVTVESLKPHMNAAENQIKKNRTLGTQVGVKGTPTVFMGSQRLQGNLTAEQLAAQFEK